MKTTTADTILIIMKGFQLDSEVAMYIISSGMFDRHIRSFARAICNSFLGLHRRDTAEWRLRQDTEQGLMY